MHAHDSVGYAEALKSQKLVTKRDGRSEPFNCEKLHKSLQQSCDGLDMNYINLDMITQKVSLGLPAGKSPSLLTTNI
jgi:transcriptional regulator NrdR family protein